MAHQNYYGTPSHQSQQQGYANYPTQRPASTGAAPQFPSHNQPVSQSFQSYSAQAYAPSGASYNLSDYSYGTTNYGASSGASRNNVSADLQNLAYASGLHDSVQRNSPQPATVNQALSAPSRQQVSYTSSSYPKYGHQQQPRPKSVNSLTGRSTQHSPVATSRQPNFSGLPVPDTGYQTPSAQPSSAQQQTMTSPRTANAYHAPSTAQKASMQLPDQTSRTLPHVTQPPAPATSTTYQWSTAQQTHADTSGSRNFETVDPTQVYDPWPEIQRKREAARAAKALEERAQAERERKEHERLERAKAEKEAEEARKAEEIRKAEEARLAEERRQAEEAQKAEQHRHEEEGKGVEAVQQARRKKANTESKMSKAAVAALNNSSPAQAAASEVEAQMRALMAQMRELNNQDPALLAKIWEEERQSHGQQDRNAEPTTQPSGSIAQQANEQPAQRKTLATQLQPSLNVQATAPPAIAPPQQQAQKPSPHISQQQHATQPPHHSRHQPQQTVAQPRQPVKRQPPSGTTAWPNDKKDQISKAASDWLNAVPENHDKQISPKEICDLLNQNPRYIDLCEWLELQGMKLERAAFARALLAAVPDINKPSPAQPSPSGPINGNMVDSPSVKTSKSSTQPSPYNNRTNFQHNPANRYSTVGDHIPSSHLHYPPPDQTQLRSPYFIPSAAGVSSVAQPAVPTPPPQVPVALMPHSQRDRQSSGSRQSSQREEDSQKPSTKAEAARKRNFSDIVDLTQFSDEEEPPAKKPTDLNNDVMPSWAAPPESNFYQRPPGPGYTLPPVVHVDDGTKNMDVAQPLNRKHALRRSIYEVKTIARDVLLATGKHPEMRPLNGHLEILKENFKKVDNTSDLSTLRWDLIDPGDPPPEILKSNLIEIEDDDADDEEEIPKEQSRPRPQFPTPNPAPLKHGSPASLRAGPSPSALSSASLSMPKRRGRPPKYSAAGSTETRDARATPSGTHDSAHDSARDRDSSSTISTPKTHHAMDNNPKPVGYSTFRQIQYGPDGTPLPKKKGRPFGWRKSIHSKEAQARATGMTPQRTSGPRPSGLRTSQMSGGMIIINSRSPSVVASSGAPSSYSIYKCQWENCAAELHNMNTLRKHVYKFHSGQNANKRWPCYWGDCQENERSIDPRTGKANGFRVFEDFKDHVEFAHLGPKSWELGDGHAGGLSESHDSASEAYLSDSRGRRVTPLIATPSRGAVEIATAAAAPAPRGPGRPKLKSDEQKAREAQADLEKKKKLIGPGLDRGGARLANEKRRMGFIDDEDFEEIVSDSN